MRDRFDQWAGNISTLQSAMSPLSLENRLRDAPLVAESVLHSLKDLYNSIQVGKALFIYDCKRLIL